MTVTMSDSGIDTESDTASDRDIASDWHCDTDS